ncbi:MAG: 2'-5' RNA ligase family protein [Planctomycetes bacterium]|nr:2'-5' RNA ligase family protein [Planctomycetota bacterium]
MPFAIELFFDPGCETRLRRLIKGLRDTQLGGTVLIEDVKARFHITLAVCDHVNEPVMRKVLGEIAQATHSLPVILSSLGMFPAAETVLFLAPVVDPELLEVHRALHARLSEFTESPWKLYRPGRWVPHCTLALKLPREGVQKALDLLMENTFPITGELIDIGVSEFEAGAVKRYVCDFPLI